MIMQELREKLSNNALEETKSILLPLNLEKENT
jgi:hypothetical protein